MKKRLISLLAVLAMMVSLIPSAVVQAQMDINIGDYVQMGTYYGEPILWRCVDIDENGPLMLSDKILCIKAFDAYGDTTSGSHGRGYNGGEHRRICGSNYWGDSNIRDWLNSESSSVSWSCGNPPDKDHLWNGYNAYDKEAGFLTNFTQSERNAMLMVTQKSLLDGYEHDSSNRNENYHRCNIYIYDVVQNYDTAYSESVTDKMFLLDVKQVNAVYNNLGDYYIGKPTQACIDNSEYKSPDLNNNHGYYWLRSPYCFDNNSGCIRYVHPDDNIVDSAFAFDNRDLGVRPAFYLNLTSVTAKSGAGTESNPYTIGDNENRGFDITRDTLPVPNNAEGFKGTFWDVGGLKEIKDDRWAEVYGEKVKPIIKKYKKGTSGGYCFGMCALAYKIYNGDISWWKNGELNEEGYDKINIVDGNVLEREKCPSIEENSQLRRLVENYQITQYSYSFRESKREYKTYREMFEYLISQMNEGETVSLSVHWGENGHQILIDTSKGIQYKDNNWVRIYLYDPNYPHYDNNENYNLPKEYENWADRYIEFNTETGECYHRVAASKSAHEIHKDAYSEFSENDEDWIRVEKLNALPNSFDGNLWFWDTRNQDEVAFYISANNFKLNDVEIQNGHIVKSDYEWQAVEGGFVFHIPKNQASTQILNNGMVLVFSGETVFGVKSDGEVKVNISDGNVKVESNEDSEVCVMSEIINGEEYDSKTIEGKLDKGENIDIKISDDISIKTTSKNNLDITTMSSDEDKSDTKQDTDKTPATDEPKSDTKQDINKTPVTNIKVGDYVQMGTYYGKPILWRCVDIDENGPLILSDKILCIKAFDAAGDDASSSHGRGYDNGFYRRSWGSNYWADSNIRDWLNSENGSINWSCGNPPDKDHLWDGHNAYDKEAGFLTNFTQSERNAMLTITQKSLLDGYEHSSNENENYYRYDSDIDDVVQNYDTAYSESVTDKMFLIDVKQVNNVYNNLGDYYMAYPTQECVDNSEYKDSSLNTDNRWGYWLRSPHCVYFSHYVRCVSAGGDVNYDDANNFDGIGVRPAFYLNLTSSDIESGSGTESNPYIITGGNTAETKTSFGSAVSSWAKDEIEKAYTARLVPDVLIGKDLTKPVNRAEFASIAVKLYENLSENTASRGNNPFIDISDNACKNDILKAYNLNITNGITDNTFEPNLLITREQVATMLTRAYKKSEWPEWNLDNDSQYALDSTGVKKFSDDAEISDWAKEPVYFMVKKDIINGMDDGTFAPKANSTLGGSYGYATREQAVVIALRSAKHL